MNPYKQIRGRDHNRCKLCGTSAWTEVHHIVYRSQGGGEEPDNLITLCKLHHDAAHAGKIGRRYLQSFARYGRLHKSCLTCIYRSEISENGLFWCPVYYGSVSLDFFCPDFKFDTTTYT